MAIFFFKLDQLFILLVPELVVWFKVVGVSFPSEPDFFQTFLSIKSKVVIDMSGPLHADPPPKKRRDLILTPWHDAMTMFSFKLYQLFISLVPELVVWFEGGRVVSFPSEPDFFQTFLSIESNFVIVISTQLISNPSR
jgi:hypothetical protein